MGRLFPAAYLFIIRVTDDQKGVVRPREDVFTRVIPANGVDLQPSENLDYVRLDFHARGVWRSELSPERLASEFYSNEVGS